MGDQRKAPRFDDRRPASEHASKAKRKNRRTDTRAEMLLRKALWARGARYRLHARDLPGKPDLVFRGKRVAVFVDGDFWHGRDWEKNREKVARRSNGDYWVAKIEYNMERDRHQTKALEALGWTVLRFWETDVKKDLQEAVEAVLAAIASRNPGGG
ncbi:very short patch repair endonuclease [Thiohalorhabdus methylotrophus]|uniref:Very short patch repair endonuclease n=1 Tax=Thiohalorhabdus methylotrophus TaxID=3242694 RepID=A0ABV4TT87_9GAMM